MDNFLAILKHVYINAGQGTVPINTDGFSKKESDIKSILIDDGEVKKLLTYYPNGFCWYGEISDEQVILRTSHPMVLNSDGMYEVQLDL